MVNMVPGSSWNSMKRMLLIKEIMQYPTDQETRYQGRFGTGQKPAMATETGDIGFNVTRPSASNPNITATQQVEPPRTVTEPVVFGDERSQGERTLAFRPTGKRRYQEGDQIREVDQLPFHSRKRIGQEFKESKILGESASREKTRLTDPKTGEGRGRVNLPDEEGRARTRKLQHAFKNQQRFLERLAQDGKPIPEGFGEFSGQHPSKLLARLSDSPEAFLYAGKGDQKVRVKRPMTGPGGHVERLGGDWLQRWKKDPLGEFQASPYLNPANWLHGTATSERRSRHMQEQNHEHNMNLWDAVGRRKILNPSYTPSKKIEAQLERHITNLIDDGSPQAQSLVQALVQNPYARELAENIEYRRLEERSLRDIENKKKKAELLAEVKARNPQVMNYHNIMDAIQDENSEFHNFPISTKGNQSDVKERWQDIHGWLAQGHTLSEIMEKRPSHFSGPLTQEEAKEVESDVEEGAGNEGAGNEDAGKKGKGKNVGVVASGIADFESHGFDKPLPPKSALRARCDELGIPYNSRTTNVQFHALLNNHGGGGTAAGGGEAAVDADVSEEEAAAGGGETAVDADVGEEEAAAIAEAKRQEARQKKEEAAQRQRESSEKNRERRKRALQSVMGGDDGASEEEAVGWTQHLVDNGIDPTKTWKIGGKTVKAAAKKAFASAGEGSVTINDFEISPSKALTLALAQAGALGKVEDHQSDIDAGKNLDSWEPVFRWLTGASLKEFGKDSDASEDPSFTFSEPEPHPIDLAWALLKGV